MEGRKGRSAGEFMTYMPDMRRDIFEPGVVLYYMERDRGQPVYDELPERLRAVLEQEEKKGTPRPGLGNPISPAV